MKEKFHPEQDISSTITNVQNVVSSGNMTTGVP